MFAETKHPQDLLERVVCGAWLPFLVSVEVAERSLLLPLLVVEEEQRKPLSEPTDDCWRPKGLCGRPWCSGFGKAEFLSSLFFLLSRIRLLLWFVLCWSLAFELLSPCSANDGEAKKSEGFVIHQQKARAPDEVKRNDGGRQGKPMTTF